VRSRPETLAKPDAPDRGRITGFAPVVGSDSRILILGSMPSVASLERQQYYGLPRNAFWPIMAGLFGVPADQPYERRLAALVKNRIALWDVIHSCRRPGSLDSSIESDSVEPNDFGHLFRAQPGIVRVFFNGRKAEQMFDRLVKPRCAEAASRDFTTLPSTSPAHAAMSFAEKLERWAVVSRDVGPANREMR